MTSLFPAAPAPKSALGRYRMLSPTASVYVSPLCLGGMSFGTAWGAFMGAVDEKATHEILDFFYDQGGNFIDTANNYQDGQSEEYIGNWMKQRGIRDQIVLATKYATNWNAGHYGKNENIHANFNGLGAKSLHLSVESSLRKLQTNYIDVLYVHWYDFNTSIEELMQSLNLLVTQGKVLYLGISDTPAWVVSKANQYARDHGLRQFVVYQGRWSAASRDFERDIIPMAVSEGMGLAPWGALGGGSFKSEAARKQKDGRQRPPTEDAIKISQVLEKIADRKNTAITSIALAYVMHKTANVTPIVGGRNIDQLKGNIDALSVELTKQDVDEIEGTLPFDLGFPLAFLYGTSQPKDPKLPSLFSMGGTYDFVESPKPITHAQISAKNESKESSTAK